MLERVGGKRKPGHLRTQLLDTIKSDTSQSTEKLTEVVQVRKMWRYLAHTTE